MQRKYTYSNNKLVYEYVCVYMDEYMHIKFQVKIKNGNKSMGNGQRRWVF